MPGYWVFRDFVDTDGENVIHTWLHQLPAEARARINALITYLQQTRPLERPYIAMLSGECDKLMELRVKYKRIQYRPLACYGPEQGQITLLVGAREVNGRFEPLSACTTAQARRQRIHAQGGTCEHDFS